MTKCLAEWCQARPRAPRPSGPPWSRKGPTLSHVGGSQSIMNQTSVGCNLVYHGLLARPVYRATEAIFQVFFFSLPSILPIFPGLSPVLPHHIQPAFLLARRPAPSERKPSNFSAASSAVLAWPHPYLPRRRILSHADLAGTAPVQRRISRNAWVALRGRAWRTVCLEHARTSTARHLSSSQDMVWHAAVMWRCR